MTALLTVIALIILNAFFALSEMALMTSRKSRLKQMAESSRGAKVALDLTNNPDNLLSTVQVGITLIGILAGVFGGDSIGLIIANWLQGIFPNATEYTKPIGTGTAVALITAGQVIFGELLPKRLALTNSEGIASTVAIPINMLATAAKPIVATLGAINRLLLRMLGIRDDKQDTITEDEIRMLVAEGHEQGLIDDNERTMMQRVMRLGDRDAESLMTPRKRIAWLDAAETFEENFETMRETPFSRYPVYRGSDAEVIGILEVKSLLEHLDRKEPELFRDLRPALFVSESTPALKLLEILREEQQSLALVVDEYGDVTGLVTINNVMEAVIGRTQSDGSAPAPLVVQRQDGSLLIDGSVTADTMREILGGSVLPHQEEHDYNTVAGMIIAHFGRIPEVGEYFDWNDWRIEVVDLDGPRIDKLLLQRLQTEKNEDIE